MFTNWEKKWESFSLEFAKQSSERSQHEWSKHYSQICILTSNIVLSCVITHINEFKLKSKEFNQKNFRKKLNSLNATEVKSLLKYTIMDFMILLIEQKETREFLLSQGIEDDDFEKELFQCFDFTQQERIIYFKMKPLSGTLEHSVHLIEMLDAKSESKNEGLLLGIEYFKKNFFDNLKKHLSTVFNKK